jgi:hypothetical protein
MCALKSSELVRVGFPLAFNYIGIDNMPLYGKIIINVIAVKFGQTVILKLSPVDLDPDITSTISRLECCAGLSEIFYNKQLKNKYCIGKTDLICVNDQNKYISKFVFEVANDNFTLSIYLGVPGGILPDTKSYKLGIEDYNLIYIV